MVAALTQRPFPPFVVCFTLKAFCVVVVLIASLKVMEIETDSEIALAVSYGETVITVGAVQMPPPF